MNIYFVNRYSKLKGPFDIIDSNRQHIIKVGDICLCDTFEGVAFYVVCNSINMWNACKLVGVGRNGTLSKTGNTHLFSFDGLSRRKGDVKLIEMLSLCFREKVIEEFFRNAIDILEYKRDLWDISLFSQFFSSSQELITRTEVVKPNSILNSREYPSVFAKYLDKDLFVLLSSSINEGYGLKEAYMILREKDPKLFRTAFMKFLAENPTGTIYDTPPVEEMSSEPKFETDIETHTPLHKDKLQEAITDSNQPFLLNVLVDKEFKELLKRYRGGDRKAYDLLIRRNKKLVLSISKIYINKGAEFDDLIQEGTIGLMKAIDHYDESYNVEFEKYAQWWIRQAVILSLTTLPHVVKLPQNLFVCHRKVWNFIKEYEQRHDNPPATNEIDIDGINREWINYIYNLPSNLNDITMRVEDFDIFESNTSTVERFEEIEYNKYKANLFLNSLPNRSKIILESYYGIGRSPQSLEEIGKELNLTRERVRQILEKSIRILRERTIKYEKTGIIQGSTPPNIVESFGAAVFGAYIEVPAANQMAKIIDIQRLAGVVSKIVLKMGNGELYYYTPDGVLIPASRKNIRKTSPEREAFLREMHAKRPETKDTTSILYTSNKEQQISFGRDAFLQEMESQRQKTIKIATELQTPKKDVEKPTNDNTNGRKSIAIKEERTLIPKVCGERDAYKTKGNELVNNISFVGNKNDNTINIIDTDVIRQIFLNTSATYKFYWFISLLQLLQKNSTQKILVYDIVARMVANAWSPIAYHQLNFGRNDSLVK